MIRAAWFFVLSLALHATALLYPVSFRGTGQVETIELKIVPMEQEAGGAQGSSETHPPRSDRKSNRIGRSAMGPTIESTVSNDPDLHAQESEALTNVRDTTTPSVPVIENSPEGDRIIMMSDLAGNHSQNSITGGIGTGNGVSASGFSGTAPGGENRSGSGSSNSPITLTQARYLETPKPGYPEIARREGREGRVLLRVLVDERGRTKAVEINSSSGNEALDRAAAEAVRRWHFYPARYHDKAIESWLRIPIEFRLADAKSW